MHGLVLNFYFLLTIISMGTFSLGNVSVRDPQRRIIIFVSKRRMYGPAFDYFITGLGKNDCHMRICTTHHKRRFGERGLLLSRHICYSDVEIGRVIVRNTGRPKREPSQPKREPSSFGP